MKTIKIISNDRKGLIENISGDFVILPAAPEKINTYIYPNDIADRTNYIIEISPDDNNPLNFNGVKIALHLYFKHLQEKKLFFFIRLIGFESKADFFYDCEYSSFLKCPNVAYQQINLDFKINIPDDINLVDTEIAIDLLKKINIKPPTSHKTHHSISNEWAIYRWSQYLGIKTSLDTEIEKSLYFQYLKTVYQISDLKETQTFLVSEGNLLLIDDEEAKGWSDFFKKLKLPSLDLKIDSIGKDFKSLDSKDDIIAECENKIRDSEFKPHTIILDLRLHDSDFEEDDPTKLTGLKVLEKIKKEINPGIQVILFTASNKVWNYQALNTIGFDGWITKESPELSVDPTFTRKALKDLKDQIDFCQKRASFLINISNELNSLKDIINKSNLFESEKGETRKKFFSNFDVTFDLLEKATQSKDFKKYFNYAYLQLFLCVEEFLKFKNIFKYGDKCYVNQNLKVAEKIDEKKWTSAIKYIEKKQNTPSHFIYQNDDQNNRLNPQQTDFKMSSVLIFFFNQVNSKFLNWPNIRDVRNRKAAHPEKAIVKKDEVLLLVNFLKYIFNSDNMKPSEQEEGLKDEEFQDS